MNFERCLGYLTFNLAIIYASFGNKNKAIEYGTKANLIIKTLFGVVHPDYANSLSNLAGYYYDLGNYAKAIEYFRQNLSICQFHTMQQFCNLPANQRANLWNKVSYRFTDYYPNLTFHIRSNKMTDLYDMSALFSKGLLLTTEMEMNRLILESGDEEAAITQTGDLVEANIPHFSIWEIVLNVKLESIDTQVNKIVDTTVNAKSGKYGFKFDYGYSCDQASNSTLIKNLLKAMFGSKKKKVNKNITWTSTEGSATVTVNQEVKTYKFVSGNKVFYVTTYGKITSSVVVNPAEETTTHGGGSN